MRKLALAALPLAVALLSAAPVAAQNASSEEAAVRAAVDGYLRSHATGDGSHVRAVFHPQLRMLWVAAGDTLSSRTAEQYISGFRGQPAQDEAQRRRWIEAVDVSGNAAIAKVILDYPGRTFTDYFALLKVNGEWKIVSKVFSSREKD